MRLNSPLKTLLYTEFEAVEPGCELVREHVTQFAGEDDDIVDVLFRTIRIAVRTTTIPETEDGEEYLERTLLIELIGDDGRYLETISNTMPQAVIIRSALHIICDTGEIHSGK